MAFFAVAGSMGALCSKVEDVVSIPGTRNQKYLLENIELIQIQLDDQNIQKNRSGLFSRCRQGETISRRGEERGERLKNTNLLISLNLAPHPPWQAG